MTGSDSRREFIADLAGLMKRWNLPQVAGQVYAYLLLREEPADLDTMVDELEMSKSGLSGAVRQLESWFLIRRISQPGTRRVLFEVDDDLERLLRVNSAELMRFSDILRKGSTVAGVATGGRLEAIAELFDVYVDASDKALEEIRERRSAE